MAIKRTGAHDAPPQTRSAVDNLWDELTTKDREIAELRKAIQDLASRITPAATVQKSSISGDIEGKMHGNLSGLTTGDDHTQYLKEKASGGVAAEVPTHTHADAANAGTVAHSALTGLTTGDDHTQYCKKAGDTISGLLTWGTNNPNPGLRLRHIEGKVAGSDTADHLYINYSGAGAGAIIGDTGTDHPLTVYGPVTCSSLKSNSIQNAGGSVMLAGGDGYLRINESSQFGSGIWFGSSVLRTYNSPIYFGGQGGDASQVVIDTNGAVDATERIRLNGKTGLVTALQFDATTPGCELYDSAGQTYTTGVATAQLFNTEVYDNGGFHSTSSNTSRITIPTGLGGTYIFNFTGFFNSNAVGIRTAYWYKNGTLYLPGFYVNPIPTGGTAVMETHIILRLSAGDYVEVYCSQSSGGNLAMYSATSVVYWPHVMCARIGA